MSLLVMPGELLILEKDETINTKMVPRGIQTISDILGIHWEQVRKGVDISFPAGTVFRVGNYRIRNCPNPTYSYMTLHVVDSPDRKWLPKSRGGTGRKMTLTLAATEFVKWNLKRYDSIL